MAAKVESIEVYCPIWA